GSGRATAQGVDPPQRRRPADSRLAVRSRPRVGQRRRTRRVRPAGALARDAGPAARRGPARRAAAQAHARRRADRAVEHRRATRLNSMRIALAQIQSGAEPTANLGLVEDYTRRAADAGARLVLFPEATMCRF